MLSKSLRRGLPAVAVLGLLLVLVTSAVRADDLRETTSLKIVPADAAFYSSCLRNREQYEAFVGSNAFAKLMAIPAIQSGVQYLKDSWANPPDPDFAEFKKFIEQPENQQLVELLGEMVSDEVFFYGDSSLGEALAFMQQINAVQQTAMLRALETGEDPGAAMMQEIADLVAKQGDKLKVPQLIIGFKLREKDKAETQLARLETVLKAALADNADLSMRLLRQQIGEGDYLTYTFDGRMIPWDEIREEDIGDAREAFEKLKERVMAMTAVVSVGIRGEYAIVGVGPSTDYLEGIGAGELLADRPEFAPLYPHQDKPITAIGYVSKEFLVNISNVEQAFGNMADSIKMVLTLSDVDPDVADELGKDMDALVADLTALVPEPGAQMGFSYLTPRGYESYMYDWTQHEYVDGSKPLTILNHVGGDPLIVAAGRSKITPESYDLCFKWLKRAGHYADYFARREISDDEQLRQYEEFVKQATPLLERAETVTREVLIPALADGQGALVIDAKLTSKQWAESLPPSETPLPVPEIAMVYGISDADAIRQAFGEYFDIAQKLVDAAHEINPDEVPPIKLEPPKSREFPSGTVYYYPLPAEGGVNVRIAPNAGLSDEFAILSYVPLQTKRCLDSTPLAVEGPLAQYYDKPLAAAGHCNFAGIIDALTPWVDYGGMMAGMFMGGGGPDFGPPVPDFGPGPPIEGFGALRTAPVERSVAVTDDALAQVPPDFGPPPDGPPGFDPTQLMIQGIVTQIKQGLEVAKCFRGVSSVSYFEDDTLVTYSEWHFEDLPAEEGDEAP